MLTVITTIRKLVEFTKRWGGQRLIVGNVFAYRTTEVRELATVDDAFGYEIALHTAQIIKVADILAPC